MLALGQSVGVECPACPCLAAVVQPIQIPDDSGDALVIAGSGANGEPCCGCAEGAAEVDGGWDKVWRAADIGMRGVRGEQFFSRHDVPGTARRCADADEIELRIQDIMPMGAVLGGVIIEVFVDGPGSGRPVARDVFGNRNVVIGDGWIGVQAVLKVSTDRAGVGEEVKLRHLAAVGGGNLRQCCIPAQRGKATAGPFKVYQDKLLLGRRKLPIVLWQRQWW